MLIKCSKDQSDRNKIFHGFFFFRPLSEAIYTCTARYQKADLVSPVGMLRL